MAKTFIKAANVLALDLEQLKLVKIIIFGRDVMILIIQAFKS